MRINIATYFNNENAQLTQFLVHEAIVNELIFEMYEFSDAAIEPVEAKEGVSIGNLIVAEEAIANCELGIRNQELRRRSG